jgi:hypothetical protein
LYRDIGDEQQARDHGGLQTEGPQYQSGRCFKDSRDHRDLQEAYGIECPDQAEGYKDDAKHRYHDSDPFIRNTSITGLTAAATDYSSRVRRGIELVVSNDRAKARLSLMIAALCSSPLRHLPGVLNESDPVLLAPVHVEACLRWFITGSIVIICNS